MRKSLESAAEQAGRSISEEVEYRLQRSFDRESLVRELYGDKHAKLLKSLINIMSMASDASEVPLGRKLADIHVLSAVILILGYENRDLNSILDGDEMRVSEISARNS